MLRRQQPVNFGQTAIAASSVQRNITKAIFETADSLVLLPPEVCLPLDIQAVFLCVVDGDIRAPANFAAADRFLPRCAFANLLIFRWNH